MLGACPLPTLLGYKGFATQPPRDGGRAGGGAVYTRNGLSILLAINTPFQSVAVQLPLDWRYTIFSAYIPPSADFDEDEFRRLVARLLRPFLFLGELNGRHPLWGDYATYPRGQVIADLVEELELGVLNVDEFTHHCPRTASFSCLDLSFCSSDAHPVFDWEVADDLHGSDHFQDHYRPRAHHAGAWRGGPYFRK